MRVLVLHSRYLSGPVSGENRVVEDETALLRENGHEVVPWTPTPDELRNDLHAGARTVWSPDAMRRVRALIAKLRPDVVHVHNLFPMLSPAVLRVVPPDTALVMTLHNYRYACLPGTFLLDDRVCEDCLGHTPWRGVVHACFRGSRAASAALATSITAHRVAGSFNRIDRFLAVSDFMRRKHIEAGIPSDRITIQRNFATAEPRRTGSGEYFLYVGRLSAEKGLSALIRLWTAIPAPLLIVGEGPQLDELRALAGPNVTFRGSVPGSEVPQLLRSARALVVPSQWYEGTPRSVIESYAVGVPVLASRIGSLAEVVEDGVSGHLLALGDEAAWTRAIRSMLDDRHTQELGDEAYRLWERDYRPERAIGSLVASYETAIERRRARR